MARPDRITNRQVADGEDAKLAALIAGELRTGTLQGVMVDFRHSELPNGEWEASPWWYVWPNVGLVFPEEAALEMTRLRTEKGVSEDTPAVLACTGDRLTVERVETQLSDARFDHPHDRERRLAFLRLERPDGEVLHLDTPLPFYGTSRIREHGTREAFDHVIERIMRHAAVGELPEYALSRVSGHVWQQPLEQAALCFAEEAHRHFFKLQTTLPEYGTPLGWMRAALHSVANSAALAGFLLGKLEGREAEVRATRQIDNARMAAEDRKDRGLIALARQIAEQNPMWRRNRIARALQERYPNKESSSINRTLRREGIGPNPALPTSKS